MDAFHRCSLRMVVSLVPETHDEVLPTCERELRTDPHDGGTEGADISHTKASYTFNWASRTATNPAHLPAVTWPQVG